MSAFDTKTRICGALQCLLAVVLIGMATVSCSDVNVNGANSNQSHMNIRLTDAPGNYQEVNIDVQGVRIRYRPASGDTTQAVGKWIDLPVDPMKVNLLDLTNGVDTLLASADLDPGHYSELRLMLGSDNTVMVDSMMQNLKVPSGEQSGYKIKFQTDLKAGEEINVSIDFDASQSVHKAGNSGKHILKPVLKAFVASGNQVETGSIGGSINPVEASPNIYAIMGDDTTATQPDEEGGFLLQGLGSGQYAVSIEPTNDQYADTTLSDVTVEKDQKTDLGVVTLNQK